MYKPFCDNICFDIFKIGVDIEFFFLLMTRVMYNEKHGSYSY